MDPPSPFRRPPLVTLSAQEDAYATLLDDSQWTQAAAFGDDDRFSTPSQRIGRNYRQPSEQDAAQLDAARVLSPPRRRKGWAPGLSCRPLLSPLEAPSPPGGSPAGSPNARQRADAEPEGDSSPFKGTLRREHITDTEVLQARFDEYVRSGVDESCLAPFNQEWVLEALKQVPHELAGVEATKVEEMLDEMIRETSSLYYNAVKAAIVTYVLRDPTEAKRLEVMALPKPPERRMFHPSQDPSVAECAAQASEGSLTLGVWHDNVLAGYEATERNLLINHDGTLQMLELWALYQHLQLCSLGSLPPVEALELERFKDQQHSHCERVVQMLKKKWYPAVVDLFQDELKHNPDEEAEPSPLLTAVSALMLNQLRGLLIASVDAYVSFVERYAVCVPPPADALRSEAVDVRPLLLVRMIVEGEGFNFLPSTMTVVKSLHSIIDHLVTTMNTMPRIEGEVGRTAAASMPAASRMQLTVATTEDDFVVAAKRRLQRVVEANMQLTETVMQAYAPHTGLLSSESDDSVDEFNRERHTLQDVSAEIAKYGRASEEVAKRSLPEVRLNMVLVNCEAVRTRLCSRADELAGRLRAHIGQQFLAKAGEICGRYHEIYLRLGISPACDREVVELEQFLQASAGMLQQLNVELNEGRKALRFLVEHSFALDDDQRRLVGETWAWPAKVKPKVEECGRALRAERDRVEDDLCERRSRFTEELDEYIVQAHAFEKLGAIERMEDNATALSSLAAKIQEAKDRGEKLNEEEALLGFPLSDFPQLAEVPSLIAPYQELWGACVAFQAASAQWLDGPMQEVDPEVVDGEVKTLWKNNFKTIKAFSEEGMPAAPLAAAEQLKGRIDAFKEKMPLIASLCNKGMRDRHWERVSEMMGQPFRPTATTSLSSILTTDLESRSEQLDEIAAAASKEFSLEKALDKMLVDWQPLEFTMVEYRDTGTHIVGGIDEIQLLLDDHLVKAQTMLGAPLTSPYSADPLLPFVRMARISRSRLSLHQAVRGARQAVGRAALAHPRPD